MKNNEDYENLIEVLKQALLFYDDKNNYSIRPNTNDPLPLIMIDGGSQAKFALEKINEIRLVHDEMEADWENILIKNKEIMGAAEDNNRTFLDLINEIKEIG
jgi:hypothetical protein